MVSSPDALSRWPGGVDLEVGTPMTPSFGVGVRPWLRYGDGTIGLGIGVVAQYRVDTFVVSGLVGSGLWVLLGGFQGDSDTKGRSSTLPLGVSLGYLRGPFGASLDVMASTFDFSDGQPVIDHWVTVGITLHLHYDFYSGDDSRLK